MITTIYILISCVDFFLDTLPTHKMLSQQPDYKKQMFTRNFSKMNTILFYVSVVNQFVCLTLLLLKLLGYLTWW